MIFQQIGFLHAEGVFARDSGEPGLARKLNSLLETIGNNQAVDAYYESLRQRGLEYGPASARFKNCGPRDERVSA